MFLSTLFGAPLHHNSFVFSRNQQMSVMSPVQAYSINNVELFYEKDVQL